MKHLFLFSALMVLFVSCGDRDEDDDISISRNAKFTFNNNQIPHPADGVLINDDDFDKCLKNSYFLEQRDGRRINADGTLDDKLFWEDIIGIGTDGYYFAADSAFKYVLYIDSDPSIPYIKHGLAYVGGKDVIASSCEDEMPYLKIVKANNNGFVAIRLVGVKSDVRPSYIYSSYRKVSESKFNKALE